MAVLILCLLACGCVSQQSSNAGLTRSERDVLRNYFASPETIEQAARICLNRGLSQTQVLNYTSDTMRREVKDDSITFFFAPSQWWTIAFGQDGKAISAEVTGKSITQETPTKKSTLSSEGAPSDER